MSEPQPEQAATALDVAHEVTGLIVACLNATRVPEGYAEPDTVGVRGDMAVVEAETRVAITLESWLGEGMTHAAAETVRGLGEALAPIHDHLHGGPR